jgi:hypothetical protein
MLAILNGHRTMFFLRLKTKQEINWIKRESKHILKASIEKGSMVEEQYLNVKKNNTIVSRSLKS